jgi:hypothetical protein
VKSEQASKVKRVAAVSAIASGARAGYFEEDNSSFVLGRARQVSEQTRLGALNTNVS